MTLFHATRSEFHDGFTILQRPCTEIPYLYIAWTYRFVKCEIVGKIRENGLKLFSSKTFGYTATYTVYTSCNLCALSATVYVNRVNDDQNMILEPQ